MNREELELELATALSGNIPLYNAIVDTFKTHDTTIEELKFKEETLNREVAQAKEVDFQNKTQIANLINRLPLFNSNKEEVVEKTEQDIIASLKTIELEGI